MNLCERIEVLLVGKGLLVWRLSNSGLSGTLPFGLGFGLWGSGV